MNINITQFQSPEERSRLMRAEDGRAAANLQTAQVGLDSQEKADESKKGLMAQAGDSVQISEEAREKQRAAAAEKSEDKSGRDGTAEGEEQESGAAGTGEQQANGATLSGQGVAGGQEESEDSESRVEQLRKQLREAQKKLQQAQEKLQQAMIKMQSAEEQLEKDAAQTEVSAAQMEVGSLTSEVQKLNEEITKALQQESQGTGGANGTPPVGSGWAPGGQRLSVGKNGITSLS